MYHLFFRPIINLMFAILGLIIAVLILSFYFLQKSLKGVSKKFRFYQLQLPLKGVKVCNCKRIKAAYFMKGDGGKLRL